MVILPIDMITNYWQYQKYEHTCQNCGCVYTPTLGVATCPICNGKQNFIKPIPKGVYA